MFPAHHAHRGLPSYGQAVPSIIRVEGTELKEFPICSKELLGHQVIFSGGGYFRLFPYRIIKRWFAERVYTISYIHPRDLDAGQPMIQGLPFSRKFKSYIGLQGAEHKLRRLLSDFSFTDISTAAATIDWDKVPIVNL